MRKCSCSESKNRTCVVPSRGSTQFEQNYSSDHRIEVADEPSVFFNPQIRRDEMKLYSSEYIEREAKLMYDSIGMEICDDRESYECGYYAGFKAREPIEITEEEIDKELCKYEQIVTEFLTGIDVDAGECNEARRVFIKAILSKLKGDE